MKCPACGFDNPEESRFCGGCGKGFGNVCPNCGEEHPSEFRFCGRCGHALREEGADEQEEVGARLRRSMPGLFQQRYVKSHSDFVKYRFYRHLNQNREPQNQGLF